MGGAAVIELQEVARRRWPRGRHPGGLGWEVATDQLPEVLEVFRGSDGRIVGWCGVEAPGSLAVETDGEVAASALTVAMAAAEGRVLEVAVAADDDALRDAVAAAGFTPEEPWWGSWRAASAADRPSSVGEGCIVRAIGDDERAARVDVHRRAWRPADLPWHPDHRPPTSADAASSFDEARFERVEQTPLYDRSLDLVVEAPDGALVACATAWFDPDLGVAEIEPLGVVPSHRRIGLAGALCLEVSARVAERGGFEVFINAGPREAYPASGLAYAKAGFEPRVRGAIWELRR